MNNNKQARYAHPSSSLTQTACRLVLRALGWYVAPFPDVKKAVVVGGPHTSNWDGLLGLVGAAALGLQANILIKSNLFFWPLGPILRRFGAIPINRQQKTGVVEQAAEQFKQREQLIMVVTPEGTRSNAPKWKTGFYHIAQQASVPIVVATADYGKKEITYPAVVMPSGDIDADFDTFYALFASITPKHPSKLSAPVKALFDAKHKSQAN
ncbi:MAG: lysophospholipid acyltransferase family protein [Natronospirillum sp.]